MKEVKRNDHGFLRFYYLDGMAAIFYRVFPTTEMLALEDLSLSSRLSTNKGESLLEKLISKSSSITNKYIGISVDKINLSDPTDVNRFFEKVDSYLEESTRKSLYNIQSVLGHRNIGEQSNFMLSMVVPEITALTIQDETFISSQERSTRYVKFDEPYISGNISKDAVEPLSKGYSELSGLYNYLFDKLMEEYKLNFTKTNGKSPSDEQIKTIITPTIRDSIRSFLPLGAKTSLVMLLSARTAENIGRKLLSNGNLYNKQAGNLFYSAVADNVPSLSTHTIPGEFNKEVYKERVYFDYSNLLNEVRISSLDAVNVKITKGSQSEKQILNSIYEQLPFKDNKKRKEEVSDYLKRISSHRSGKFDDLNDSLLRSSFLQIDITCSLGTARDLWRHRLSNRNMSIHLNDYILPGVIYRNDETLCLSRKVLNGISKYSNELYKKGFNSELELLVPFATKVNLKMSMSLAEAIFIAENRSTDEAHPEYKKIAFDLYDELRYKYPNILRDTKVFLGNSGRPIGNMNYSRVPKASIDTVNDTLF
ncbi:MAG: FAD-dependent thymidylate synthase [Candidatus Parvarchaeum sp.]